MDHGSPNFNVKGFKNVQTGGLDNKENEREGERYSILVAYRVYAGISFNKFEKKYLHSCGF